MKYVRMNNGVEMPILGLGMFRLTRKDVCSSVLADAISLGYRKFDTAALYGNEPILGDAIRRSGVPREEFFITSKLWVQDAGYKKTHRAFEHSLEALGLDYLDTYLIHQPYGDYYGSWRALEELSSAGKIRAIGVSNFSPERLTDLCLHVKVRPALNQIECHVFHQQREYLRVMNSMDVHLEAWAPLAEGSHGIFTNPLLTEIGNRYGKTPAQVALRYLLQRGISMNPKTVHGAFLRENIGVFDFLLDTQDMARLAALDTEQSGIIDHTNPCTVRMICGCKIRSSVI